MSTRCQIGFYSRENHNTNEPDRILYRHQDGHPKMMVPELLPILNLFNKRRGLDDVASAAAWVIHDQIERHIQYMKEWAAESRQKHPDFKYQPEEDGKDCLSYGVSNGFHGDIAYYYAVMTTDKGLYTLNVYQVNQDDVFTLINSIELETK